MTPARDIAELADLHALGLLDPAEAAEVERRALTEPTLAAALTLARERFLELDLAATPVEPSPELWAGVAEMIAAEPQTAAPPPVRPARPPRRGAQPAALPRHPRAPEARPDARPDARPGSPARRPAPERRWRLAALGAMAASVALAVGLGWRIAGERPPETVAVLLSAEGEPVALVSAFADDSVTVTPLAGLDAPAAMTLQVWTKWDEGVGPVSLGLLERVAQTRLGRADLPEPLEGQLYEITAEPPGGSPTGRPTGPILGKGLASPPRL